MSIASTRKVSTSLSYSQPVKGGYEAVSSRQSFVETIDTTNNVSIGDNESSRSGRYFGDKRDDFSDNVFIEAEAEVEDSEVSGGFTHPTVGVSSLLDNDDIQSSVYQNQSVNIYGNNQAISSEADDKIDNPYLKYFYENNKVMEDIDEFV